MIKFVIVGDVTDRSHLRITYLDELYATGSCKGKKGKSVPLQARGAQGVPGI